MMKPLLLSFLLLLTACAGDERASTKVQPAPGQTAAADGGEITQCPLERSPVCTREYRPVCGLRQDGSEKSYANACEACADVQVVSYYPQACSQAP